MPNLLGLSITLGAIGRGDSIQLGTKSTGAAGDNGSNTPERLSSLPANDLAIIFSLRRGAFLTVHPLRLLGKYKPAGRHFFECSLYG